MQYISMKFKSNIPKNKNNNISVLPSKKANISKVPSLIPLRPSKKVLEKSKFYKGKEKTNNTQTSTQSSYLYT